MSNQRFIRDMRRYAEKTSQTLEDVAIGFKVELFTGIIKDTPVDTGRLRGNWQTSTGAPKTSEIERIDPDGGAATREVETTVKPDTIDYLSNNLPYASFIEERAAMVAKNVERVNRTMQEVVRDVT